MLANPIVDAAVLETARGGILRAGLGFDYCDVAVVTNIGEGDHLGLSGVETLESLAQVKRVIVEAVPPGGAAVLNAADPLVAAMASHCAGSGHVLRPRSRQPGDRASPGCRRPGRVRAKRHHHARRRRTRRGLPRP